MTNSTKSKQKQLVHEDCIAIISSHTVVSFNYQDIIDEYDAETWESLKQNILSRKIDFICEKDGHIYLGIESGDTPHEYIFAGWKYDVEEWDFIEKN